MNQLHPLDWGPVALSRAKGFSTTLGGKELKQPDYAVVVDESTGLLRRKPSLSEEELDFYYEHNDWRRHCSDHLFPTEVALLEELVGRLPSGARVLDLGCGDGRFLTALPDSFSKFGTELSSGAARQAMERGVAIVQHADVLAGGHGMFDAIVMIDLFEHLSDPHLFISSIISSVKDGGFIGIATGNGDFWVVRRDPANHWYFRVISHLCMWTEDFAVHAEKTLPIRRVARRFCSHYRFRLKDAVSELSKEFAYDVFHTGRWKWLSPFAFYVPVLRRARSWVQRPSARVRSDHIVTVFRVER
jgi:SAM-dependent methyltransferase